MMQIFCTILFALEGIAMIICYVYSVMQGWSLRKPVVEEYLFAHLDLQYADRHYSHGLRGAILCGLACLFTYLLGMGVIG